MDQIEHNQVMVLDVFDDLCPVCEAAAPQLNDLYEKYQAGGVTFVGLTYAEREAAEKFVHAAQIEWPVGYGAGKTIADLVGPAPTVFVMDREGRVFWHDDRSRFRHDLASFQHDLDAAIQRALATAR